MDKKQSSSEVTIDQLALMIGKGFAETNGKIDKLAREMNDRFSVVDGRFTEVNDKFLHVNARLDTIERDIKEPEMW